MPRIKQTFRRCPSMPTINYGSDDELEPIWLMKQKEQFASASHQESIPVPSPASSFMGLSHSHSAHQRRRKRKPPTTKPTVTKYSMDDSCVIMMKEKALSNGILRNTSYSGGSSCTNSISSSSSREQMRSIHKGTSTFTASPIRRSLSHDGDGLGRIPMSIKSIERKSLVRKRTSPPNYNKTGNRNTTSTTTCTSSTTASSTMMREQRSTLDNGLLSSRNLSNHRRIAASLSFRRKKKGNRKRTCTLRFYKYRWNFRLCVNLLALVFIFSFAMSFVTYRSDKLVDTIRYNGNRSTTTDDTKTKQQGPSHGRRTKQNGAISSLTISTTSPESHAKISHPNPMPKSPSVQLQIVVQRPGNNLRGGNRLHQLKAVVGTESENLNSKNNTPSHAIPKQTMPDGIPHVPQKSNMLHSDVKEHENSSITNKYNFQTQYTTAPTCHPIAEEEIDFTLVTQLSLNRLWMLEHHCHRWGTSHLISMAVYVGNTTIHQIDILDQIHAMGCSIEHITVQTVSGYSEEEYPVNVLRNLAMMSVTTSHVVYVDVDFWESMDLYDHLVLHKHTLANNPNQALVLPAFQLMRQCPEWRDCRENNIPQMPNNKEELIELMIQSQSHHHHHPSAGPFDPTNIGGHGSTRYRDWLDQRETELLPIECIQSNRYEPYLVVRYCSNLPPFQEIFTGYGKNKMTWMMHLRQLGYQFHQLGGSFVIHYPHLDSMARQYWNGGKNGTPIHKPNNLQQMIQLKRSQIDQTYLEFRSWLKQSVPDQTIVPMCTDAMNDDERLWVIGKE